MNADKLKNAKAEAALSTTHARTVLWDTLLGRYGHGAVLLAGEDNAFYERHLVFDNVIDPGFAQSRERFEAFARSIRDALARRWVMTRRTYNTENPKRIYYLSMEFLIGRSLLNNVSNLELETIAHDVAQ